MPNDAACFVALWQTVSNVWQFVRSASAIGSQPISWVYVGILRSVRNQFRGCMWVYCGVFAANFVGVRGYIAECFAIHFVVFATHSQSVQNTFTERSQRVRFLYVTYSHYKSMVFDVQKYGF